MKHFLGIAALLLSLPAVAATAGEPSIATLVKDVKANPRTARFGCTRLSNRGPQGWSALARIARESGKAGDEATARAAIDALASGDEAQRHSRLRGLASSLKGENAAHALAAMARWYPKDAAAFTKYLRKDRPARGKVLLAAARHGMPVKELKSYRKEPAMAQIARLALTQRSWGFKSWKLHDAARRDAKHGHRPRDCRNYIDKLIQRRDPELLRAFALSLLDPDPKVRRGAHLILLTASGKDLAPDADIWRSWIAANGDKPLRRDSGSPGAGAAAVLRGRTYLRFNLRSGMCTWVAYDRPTYQVGATALAVLALRAARVPADDPVILKALQTTLLVYQPGQPPGLPALQGDTYALSLLAMALAAVDAKKHRALLKVLGAMITRGQLPSGQWGYRCLSSSSGASQRGDNSNTQYAILGLRAVRRAGVAVDPAAWERCAGFWRREQHSRGGWAYRTGKPGNRQLSMTAAGIGTLAICIEGLHVAEAGNLVGRDENLKNGLKRMGEILLDDKRAMWSAELYALYGIERAGVLTGVRAFDKFDWYRSGTRTIVMAQGKDGSWGDDGASQIANGVGYGRAVDTAYALLFLKRATTRIGDAEDGVVKVYD